MPLLEVSKNVLVVASQRLGLVSDPKSNVLISVSISGKWEGLGFGLVSVSDLTVSFT